MTHCSPAVTVIGVPAYSEAIGDAHSAPTAPLDDQAKPHRDRPFNPWRIARTEAARTIIAEAVGTLQAHEEALNLRRRKRRQSDQETFEATVSAILSDLIYHHLKGFDGGVFITRSNRILGTKSRYKPTAYGKTLPAVLDLMSALAVGMVEQVIGRTHADGQNKNTTIRAGTWLLDRIDSRGITLEDLSVSDRQEVIVLRRCKEDFWDEGGDHEYEDDPTTRHYRTQMTGINASLRDADITFDEAALDDCERVVDDGDRHLRRVFTQERFDSGGRLFGGFWQGLSKKERLRGLMIGGETAVELDYGEMAPRVVYGLSGVQPDREDLYAIPRYGSFREGIKLVMNAMLFSSHRLTRMPKGGRKHFRRWHRIEDVMVAIEEAHLLIRHQFFTGIGHETQFTESQILIDVLLLLKAREIVALPIHDAILVPSSRHAEARGVMLACFLRHTELEGVVDVKAVPQRITMVGVIDGGLPLQHTFNDP